MVPPQVAFPTRTRWSYPNLLHWGGFSLVEVAIALGIFSVGMVAMMGLLPLGLKVSRESIAAVVESNILQYIASEAELTDFDNLDQFKNKQFYFDDEGCPLASKSDGNHLYTVTADVLKNMDIPGASTQKWGGFALIRISIQPNSQPKIVRAIHLGKLQK